MYSTRNPCPSTKSLAYSNSTLCFIRSCLRKFYPGYFHGSSKFIWIDLHYFSSLFIFFQGIYEQSRKNEYKNVSSYPRSSKEKEDIDDDDYDEPQTRLVRIKDGTSPASVFLSFK